MTWVTRQCPTVPVTSASLRDDLRATAIACAGFSLLLTAVFWRSLRTGLYIAPSDSLDFGLATFLARPEFWTEGMYSGYPVVADPQAMAWYLPFHVARLFGLGWNAFMILPYVVASTGAFLLVRRLSGSNLAGALSGLAFGYSGTMLAHISHFNQIHAASWMPFVVFGMLLARQGQRAAGTVVGAVAVALMISAGHPQNVVYAVYVCGAVVFGWTIADGPSWRVFRARTIDAICVFGLGMALAAVVILPMLELASFSRRASGSWDLYASKALPPWQLLTLVFPLSFGGFSTAAGAAVDYIGDSSPGEMTGYAGLLPLSLAVWGPFLVRTNRREVALWSAIALAAVLLCLGGATPVGTAFFYAPGYSSFRVPARHFFVFAFAVSVAAGLVFNELVAAGRRWALCGSVCGTLGAGLLAGAVLISLSPAVRELALSNSFYQIAAVGGPVIVGLALVLVVIAVGTLGQTWALGIALLVVQVGEMSAFHYVMPGYHFARYAQVGPADVTAAPAVAAIGAAARAEGQRVLAADGSRNPFLRPNLPRAWGIPAASGTGSLGSAAYGGAMQMGGPGDIGPEALLQEPTGIDLFAVRYVLVPESWGVTDTLTSDQPTRWSVVNRIQFRTTDPDTRYAVLENRRARPPAWCTPSAKPLEDEEARVAIVSGRLGDDGFDPQQVALVGEERPALNGRAGEGLPRVERVDAASLRQFRVQTAEPCLFVLSESFYPWWRASIDGVDILPERVNLAMVGVRVPAGEHTVTFRLTPTSVWQGLAISTGALLAVVGLAARLFWRARTHVQA